MFEIDLLKGKGRPHKTDLKRLAMKMVFMAIPLGATIIYAAGIQHDRMQLSHLQQTTQANEERLGDYAEDMRFLNDLRRQIGDVSLSINDIGMALKYRRVTSPVLVELAEALPVKVVLSDMQWKRACTRERKTDADTGKVSFETVIQRMLKLSLYGREDADSDTAVQGYIADLKSSPTLKPFLREIRPASREQTEIHGESVTVYEIELFFKDQR